MLSDFNKELIQIINKSPVVVFLWKNSKGWPVEFVSENIKVYGYEPNEFLSRKILYADLIHPDDRTRIENEVETYADSDISEFTQEYRILTKNKKICWVDDRTFIRRDEKGRVTHYQGIILDITKRKELEQRISESEYLFRKILENTFIGFAIHQENSIVYVNKALSMIVGYPPEELLRWDYSEFIEKVHPDYRETVINRLQIHLKGDENVYTFTEFPIYTKTGELKWVYTNEKSIRYHDKPAIITALVDITEMKRIEKKFFESQQNYRKAYERENFYKDLFTHDMRNILHGILNILEIYHLKEGTKGENESLKDIVNKMKIQISRGTTLIKNVRKISEVEGAGKNLTRINLFCKIKDVCRDIKGIINNKDVDISLNSFNEEIYILADDLIDFIINNILMNSIIHNHNTLVEINIQISQYQDNSKDYIKIEFIDNGEGIPDYKKKLIFNREFSKEKSTIGMGLGLSLVKKVLESYKAEIAVEDKIPSDYSQGSKFIITFPQVDLNYENFYSGR